MEKLKNVKSSIWFIVIGIFLLAIDFLIPVGKIYPTMVKATEYGDMFQNNVINYFIGTQPKLDLIPDLLGFVLIFIGSGMLIKKSKKFIAAMLLIPVAIVLYIMIPQLPYHFQAESLYLKAAGYNFLIVIVEILIEFYVIHGIVTMTSCVQNNWQNNELLAGWIIAMMSKGLLVGIDFFFGKHVFYNIYSIVMIAATVFYVNRLFKTLEYKPEDV